jgi:hypothetical protein
MKERVEAFIAGPWLAHSCFKDMSAHFALTIVEREGKGFFLGSSKGFNFHSKCAI